MIKDSIGFISNYFWSESIKNINTILSEDEIRFFNSNDYYYLTIIHNMKGPSFTQVAEALKFTKPAITQMVGKLSRIGLIEKTQSKEDKRFYYLSLTEKGKRIIHGDNNLYSNFETLISKFAKSTKKYNFIENILEEIVEYLKNNAK